MPREAQPHSDQRKRDEDGRWSSARAEFNEGWGETIAKLNRARERGEWPFTMPRPGWDAQHPLATDEERAELHDPLDARFDECRCPSCVAPRERQADDR